MGIIWHQYNGSLLFHCLTNGWLQLKTIEEPSGAIVAPKTIIKPLGPMVGGTIEKPALPFYGLTNG